MVDVLYGVELVWLGWLLCEEKAKRKVPWKGSFSEAEGWVSEGCSAGSRVCLVWRLWEVTRC